MASNVINASKSGPKSVPQPGTAKFVLGSRPAVLRAPDLPRIKAGPTNTRDYGKQPGPPLGGDTGMTGLS